MVLHMQIAGSGISDNKVNTWDKSILFNLLLCYFDTTVS